MERLKTATRIITIASALVWLAVATSVASSETSIDLNGAWKLERKENFDEYLRKSGANWFKRKLAALGSSNMRVTIKHEGNEFEITGENPVETRTDLFIADGVTKRTVETATGDEMTWTARVKEAALVLDGHGDLGHRIIRREVIDGTLVTTITNPDADTQCKLFFERLEED